MSKVDQSDILSSLVCHQKTNARILGYIHEEKKVIQCSMQEIRSPNTYVHYRTFRIIVALLRMICQDCGKQHTEHQILRTLCSLDWMRSFRVKQTSFPLRIPVSNLWRNIRVLRKSPETFYGRCTNGWFPFKAIWRRLSRR